MTEGSPLRIRRLFRRCRARRASAGRQALPPRLGILLYALLFPAAALAYAPGNPYEDIHLGLTAGVAMACGLACALAWAATRNAAHGAGLAFMLVEGLFRATPSLLPPGALQAGSYAALLALTVPFLSGSPTAQRLAAACRWAGIVLAVAAALALIFAYGPGNGTLSAAIAGACAMASLPRGGWFMARAARRGPGSAAALALAVVYGVSAWILGHDALRQEGADGAGAAFELARLLLVSGALLLLAIGRQAGPQPLAGRGGPAPADAAHLAQGELRLAELAGALDTQRQMNALISHELRAPLATISAAAQSLDMILADGGDTVGGRLARIHRSVGRMTELMDQLLNQDRLGEQAWTPRGEQTDMAELARDVVAAMRPDTAHALVLQAEAPLPVYCDRPLTSVVVRNLIHNAVKYSPANEPVRIETGQTRAGGVAMAWVAVTDRGPGIGEEEQTRIFEPHFRRAAHRETQGMGIGLYLARRICQNQGGSLTMQSKVGVGTRFVVTLPAGAPAA
ncbi:MAG: HAMP domain-containing histidine kinase [Achromobacter sp.]|uniref:sensor histidine kinase n=1 Tax=Achromobacter sp. TaxID=134375 RepID=UPI00258AF805|nr:HAMP domain-containing sensor histidine kinase [Achromobacter sp.]MCW0211267.1 HAMP domain-containing histidine kinase [Achromobacter sp.]